MQDENQNKEIAELIRSGEYYKDALRWFSTCYHSPMSERNHYILVTIVAVAVTWFSISAFKSMFPLAPEVPFPIVVLDGDNVRADINALAEDGENVNFGLRRYFVRDYVLHRETYVVEELEDNIKRIRQMSTPELYEDYRKYMNPQNPASPVVLYERHSTRNIALKRYTIEQVSESSAEGDREYKATVEFDATTVNSSKEENTTRWIAEMHFRYHDVQVDQESFEISPMNVVFTQYASHEVRAEAQ